MGMLGGLFNKSGNLAQIAEVVKTNLGLTLVAPSKDVLQILDAISEHDLKAFAVAHSLQGMQEIFRARSIRAVADPNLQSLALFVVDPNELEEDRPAPAPVRVIHFEARAAPTPPVAPTPPPEAPPVAEEAPVEIPTPTAPAEELIRPHGLEHLEACEHLCQPLVDFLVKHGQLNSGDKEVIRRIKPTATTFEGRVAALERWQAEVSRRLRAVRVAKAQPLILGAEAAPSTESAQVVLVHRFEAVTVWLGKLLKGMESTGYRYHDKPMWLPH